MTDSNKNKSSQSEKTTVARDATVGTIVADDPTQVTQAELQDKTVASSHGDRGKAWVDIGSVIKDRFVLHELLGKGGMGAVFRAIDKRREEAGDNEPFIAIKILGESFKHHKHAFVSLQREAKKTNQLAHPNIVTVYDFDRDGDLIYLTMEELRGQSLKEAIDDGSVATFSFTQKIDLIRQIASGLDYAHSKDIVHSDLKPANIFLTDDFRIKVLDFGIARAANAERDRDSFDAGVLGALTPAYASWEMFNGDAPHPSDDVYALGIVACEILIKRHPYQRTTAVEADKQKLKPDLSAAKNFLVRGALKSSLALKRQHRIPDAGAFLRKLNRALNAPKIFGVVAIVTALALSTNYWYIQTIEPEAVPFDSLSEQAQLEFRGYMAEADRALRFGDLQGAVTYIDSAYQIHTSSDEMKTMQERVINMVTKAMETANSPEQRAVNERTWETLKSFSAFSDLESD
jgi:serine/threonine protein kinase